MHVLELADLRLGAERAVDSLAVMRYVLHNKTDEPVTASVCGCLPNFIGMDGWDQQRDWKGDLHPTGAKANRNAFRDGPRVRGIAMSSEGVDEHAPQWGTLALVTTAKREVSQRTNWPQRGWGGALLDFWEDFSDDGAQEQREDQTSDMPMASLAVKTQLPAHTPGTVPAATHATPMEASSVAHTTRSYVVAFGASA